MLGRFLFVSNEQREHRRKVVVHKELTDNTLVNDGERPHVNALEFFYRERTLASSTTRSVSLSFLKVQPDVRTGLSGWNGLRVFLLAEDSGLPV